jgi:distribution and morphology protein 34
MTQQERVPYETVPAVVGEFLTRPCVFHAHFQLQPRATRPASLVSTSIPLKARRARAITPTSHGALIHYTIYISHLFGPLTSLCAPSLRVLAPSEAQSPPRATHFGSPCRPRAGVHLHESGSHTHAHSVPTSPSTDVLPPAHVQVQARAIMSTIGPDADAHIVLCRAHRAAPRTTRRVLDVRHARALQPYHTLSPYTRALSHFTVRSGPRRAPPALPRSPPRARTCSMRLRVVEWTKIARMVRAKVGAAERV